MKITLEVLEAILMAMVPGILEVCILTDREPRTSRRYLWYLPPSILALVAAITIAIPGVPNLISGIFCWSAAVMTWACVWHDAEESLATLHAKLLVAAMVCALFGTVCWCVGY